MLLLVDCYVTNRLGLDLNIDIDMSVIIFETFTKIRKRYILFEVGHDLYQSITGHEYVNHMSGSDFLSGQ